MYLKRIHLENFRSFVSTDIDLRSDLTIITGENACGKTNLVDSIRMTLPSIGEARGLTFTGDRDRRLGGPETGATRISITFDALTPRQLGIYMTELVDGNDSLTYNFDFNPDPDTAVWKRAQKSVGQKRLEDAEPENIQRIAHVYLPPLRDAVREMDAVGGDRLAEVMRVITLGDTDSREAFIEEANNLLAGMAALDLPIKAQRTIADHLSKVTPPKRHHGVVLDARHHEIRRLASLLRLRLSDAGLDPMTMGLSGLGYANLAYIATVIIQLANARDKDLTVLIVEEPEAHLHPELQSVLLTYLQDQARQSAHEERCSASLGAPAGRIQVVVTTHSPHLVSSLSIKHIVALGRHYLSSPHPQDQEVYASTWETRGVAMAGLGLKLPEMRKLDRYLTATRSSLLFARNIVLVEGIAEAVLIHELAKLFVRRRPNVTPQTKERAYRHLASVTWVSVDGVDFEPYLKLLLRGDMDRVDRVVVITDGDKDKNKDQQGKTRAKKYSKLFEKQHKEGALKICVGDRSLEPDLFARPDNEDIMRSAYLELHSQSAVKWDDLFAELPQDPESRSSKFAENLPDLDIRKGDFAQVIADAVSKIDEGAEEEQWTQAESSAGADMDGIPSFTLPGYLEEAIEAIVGDLLSAPAPQDSEASAVSEVSTDAR